MKKLKIPSLKRTTKRLVLRPLQMRDDRAWMASHCAMLPTKSPWEIPRVSLSQLSFAEFMKTLTNQKAEIEADTRYTLGIFHKEVGTLLGYLFVQNISHDRKEGVLDFRIINIYCGNGFAKEAVKEGLKLKFPLKIGKLQLNPKSLSKIKL